MSGLNGVSGVVNPLALDPLKKRKERKRKENGKKEEEEEEKKCLAGLRVELLIKDDHD